MNEGNGNQNVDCCKILKSEALYVGATVVLLGVVFALLIYGGFFFYSQYPSMPLEIETVERTCKSEAYVCKKNQKNVCCKGRCCNCCCKFPKDDSFTDSSESRSVTKSNTAPFISFIICASFILVVAFVCVTLLAINANKDELKRKKLYGLKYEKDILESLLKEGVPKQKETIEDGKLVTEYYPQNKAVADIFKAYANAIADL